MERRSRGGVNRNKQDEVGVTEEQQSTYEVSMFPRSGNAIDERDGP